ncbi:hypothetical protein LINGRAHAP2_LOCUS31136 [Linum grandiflorum]
MGLPAIVPIAAVVQHFHGSAGGGSAVKEPDPLSGTRRPLPTSNSLSAGDERETQHANKKVRPLDLNPPQHMEEVTVEDVTDEENTQKSPSHEVLMEDAGTIPNAWTQCSNKLFEEFRFNDGWYIADSDYEDVADSMREEDDYLDDETCDPLCPPVLFMAAEKISFR